MCAGGPAPSARAAHVASVVVLVSAGLFAVEAVSAAASPPGTIVVNTTDDVNDGVCDATHCSLREAIDAANANPDADMIAFALPGSAPYVIQPASELPAITTPVELDGTVSGNCASGRQGVVLDGSLMPYPAFPYGTISGLRITGGSTTVRGIAVKNFNAHGIAISGAGGNTVECSLFGLDDTGAIGANTLNGIDVRSSNNLIGGATADRRNVLSGGWHGVQIAFSSGNVVRGNYAGTDITGSTAIPNGGGIDVATGADSTIVRDNVASGNGVGIYASNNTGLVVRGNIVGLDATGTYALGNDQEGIEVNQSPGALVGGSAPGEGNVISATPGGTGLMVFWSPGTMVKGNLIGTNAAGTAVFENSSYGIFLNDTTNTTVGGPNAGDGNLIAGGGYAGIYVAGCLGGPPSCSSPADGNVIQGNHIGVGFDGVTDLGSAGPGIGIAQSSNTTIGGAAAGEGNVIAYNAIGIDIYDSIAPGNAILGNAIYANDGLGIDLGGSGLSLNDTGDVDSGANLQQNFPQITAVTPGFATATIDGTLDAQPSTTHRIEVFRQRRV